VRSLWGTSRHEVESYWERWSVGVTHGESLPLPRQRRVVDLRVWAPPSTPVGPLLEIGAVMQLAQEWGWISGDRPGPRARGWAPAEWGGGGTTWARERARALIRGTEQREMCGTFWVDRHLTNLGDRYPRRSA